MRVILVPLGGEACDRAALAAAYQIGHRFDEAAPLAGPAVRTETVTARCIEAVGPRTYCADQGSAKFEGRFASVPSQTCSTTPTCWS
jgi:hypothetical protein